MASYDYGLAVGAGGEDAGGGDEVGDAFDLVAPEADGVEARYSAFFTQDYVREAGDVGDGGGVGRGGNGAWVVRGLGAGGAGTRGFRRGCVVGYGRGPSRLLVRRGKQSFAVGALRQRWSRVRWQVEPVVACADLGGALGGALSLVWAVFAGELKCYRKIQPPYLIYMCKDMKWSSNKHGCFLLSRCLVEL